MVQTFSLENINITALQTKSVEWVGANILTLDFGVQMAIITLSFIAAFFIRKYSKPRLNDL